MRINFLATPNTTHQALMSLEYYCFATQYVSEHQLSSPRIHRSLNCNTEHNPTDHNRKILMQAL